MGIVKILVFGNPLMEKDRLALEVAERLEGKIKRIEFEPVQELPEQKGGDLYIMDVALGIKKVELFEGLDFLEKARPFGSHDFDLGFELKLLEKIGKLGKARVVAIPAGYPVEKAVEEAERILNGFSSLL